MKRVSPIICTIAILLLNACDKATEQSPNQPPVVDIEAAAQAWNTADKAWDDLDLFQLEEGKRLYEGNCSACHSTTGEGQQSFGAPALKGSAIVKGPADVLINLVLDGRNSMPSFRSSLDAPTLAVILTYVRNAWGNNTDGIIETADVEAYLQTANQQAPNEELQP